MDVYLITGASGHLGRVLVSQLLAQEKPVRLLLLPEEPNVFGDCVQVFRGDVTDILSLAPFFEKQSATEEQIVIHCAGIISIFSHEQPKMEQVNILGTQNIVTMSQKKQVKQLVYISSVHAIPERPQGEWMAEISEFSAETVVGAYAKTKAEATRRVFAANKEGLGTIVIHPSGIIGPFDQGNGLLTNLIIQYLQHKLPFGVQGGYDFVDVRDVATGILLASAHGRSGESYLLTNRYYTVKEILDTLAKVTGEKPITHYFSPKALMPFAFLAERYYLWRKQKPLFTPYSLYTLSSNAQFSHEKATKELGYNPRLLEETLMDTIEWLKAAEIV